MSDIQTLVEESIALLVREVNVDTLIDTHLGKVHFIPIKYRVLGGFLQSLNIKFGDFIETLVSKIVASSEDLEIILSKQKGIQLELSPECEEAINRHIDYKLKSEEIREKLPDKLERLYDYIFKYQLLGENFASKSLDIDTLFKHKIEKRYYYVEIKYNDDHDTGKFTDINRKLLKTYAGLVRYLKVNDKSEFKPILYYFNSHRRYYPSPYLREDEEVLRGEQLFKRFNLPISYGEVETKLSEIENALENKFDTFREEIFNRVRERTRGSQTTLL